MDMLKEELNTYEKHKEELLGKAKGSFVLIHGSDVVDIFTSKNDAIIHGYKLLGNQPFLVKHVEEVELPAPIVSNLLNF